MEQSVGEEEQTNQQAQPFCPEVNARYIAIGDQVVACYVPKNDISVLLTPRAFKVPGHWEQQMDMLRRNGMVEVHRWQYNPRNPDDDWVVRFDKI